MPSKLATGRPVTLPGVLDAELAQRRSPCSILIRSIRAVVGLDRFASGYEPTGRRNREKPDSAAGKSPRYIDADSRRRRLAALSRYPLV